MTKSQIFIIKIFGVLTLFTLVGCGAKETPTLWGYGTDDVITASLDQNDQPNIYSLSCPDVTLTQLNAQGEWVSNDTLSELDCDRAIRVRENGITSWQLMDDESLLDIETYDHNQQLLWQAELPQRFPDVEPTVRVHVYDQNQVIVTERYDNTNQARVTFINDQGQIIFSKEIDNVYSFGRHAVAVASVRIAYHAVGGSWGEYRVMSVALDGTTQWQLDVGKTYNYSGDLTLVMTPLEGTGEFVFQAYDAQALLAWEHELNSPFNGAFTPYIFNLNGKVYSLIYRRFGGAYEMKVRAHNDNGEELWQDTINIVHPFPNWLGYFKMSEDLDDGMIFSFIRQYEPTDEIEIPLVATIRNTRTQSLHYRYSATGKVNNIIYEAPYERRATTRCDFATLTCNTTSRLTHAGIHSNSKVMPRSDGSIVTLGQAYGMNAAFQVQAY